VESILAKLADEQDEDLDWKTSIVDLMKLLKLDSSLGARKQLAQELGYTGALDGSAAMNVWLQKQVMTKLAESGGKEPDSLKAWRNRGTGALPADDLGLHRRARGGRHPAGPPGIRAGAGQAPARPGARAAAPGG